MTDPFYPLMLQHNLGSQYKVWVKSARIEFITPGRNVATAKFELTDARLAEIRMATENGDKSLPEFSVAVCDTNGKLIASVETVVYVRLARKRALSQ